MAQQAADFRIGFQRLLKEATELADRSVSHAALDSQQFATKYTLEAERLTEYYTGMRFDFALTRRETMLTPAQGGAHLPTWRMKWRCWTGGLIS